MLPAIKQPLLVRQFLADVTTAVSRRLEQLGLLETTHAMKWDAGVTSGEVTVETADEFDYAGTWAPVAVVTFAVAASDPANLLGKQDYVRVQGSYAAMRHRITAPVVGGTVSTTLTGSV